MMTLSLLTTRRRKCKNVEERCRIRAPYSTISTGQQNEETRKDNDCFAVGPTGEYVNSNVHANERKKTKRVLTS